MPSETERRNIELTRQWAWNWNNDVDRMVDQSYAPDCVVVNMFSGHEAHGREALRELEHAIAAFDGTRRMEITNMVASGNVVAIQVTFNGEGLIVSDNTYGEDPSGASLPTSDHYVDEAKV
jgi:ketosteroid isomerase-like protein